VVQQTLDHATPQNVTEMQQALTTIYSQHSQGYRHDYVQEWQVLDIVLNQAAPLVGGIVAALQASLASAHVVVSLGQI
jgi:hypothetical protein